jgi:hypothetical protein
MKLFSSNRSWVMASALALGASGAWALKVAAVAPGTFSNS